MAADLTDWPLRKRILAWAFYSLAVGYLIARAVEFTLLLTALVDTNAWHLTVFFAPVTGVLLFDLVISNPKKLDGGLPTVNRLSISVGIVYGFILITTGLYLASELFGLFPTVFVKQEPPIVAMVGYTFWTALLPPIIYADLRLNVPDPDYDWVVFAVFPAINLFGVIAYFVYRRNQRSAASGGAAS